jgi:hypothetical protein
MALRDQQGIKKISMNLTEEEHQKLYVLSKTVSRSSMNRYLACLISDTYDKIINKPLSDFNLVPHPGGGYIEAHKLEASSN